MTRSPQHAAGYADADRRLRLTWLLVALPAGRRGGAAARRPAHRQRGATCSACAPPVRVLRASALVMFFAHARARTPTTAQSTSTCSPGSRSAASTPTSAFLLDPLSMCFVLLITGVGSLIHVYSIGYMEHDPSRRRFFGYLNLFVAAMLLLVLADNYLLLYVGWEGVGLASYLLIGFWHHKPSAATAAKKAFLVNRVGDVGLSIAIMLMFATVRHLRLRRRLRRGADDASEGTLTAIGLLLLLAACGKSRPGAAAVLARSTRWRARRPVSALIHAATMVTAGVYLIARSDADLQRRAGRAQPRSRSSARSRCCSARSSAARRTTSRRRSPARR